MTMSGEELNRKYHELCGWRQIVVEPRDIRLKSNEHRQLVWSDPDGKWSFFDLPPLHLDANLAIAEADRAFAVWDLKTQPHLQKDVTGIMAPHGGTQRLYEGSAEGQHAFCEAILKALIAAKESK